MAQRFEAGTGEKVLLTAPVAWPKTARMRAVAVALAGGVLLSTPAAAQPFGSTILAPFSTSSHSRASPGAILPAPTERPGGTTSSQGQAPSGSFQGVRDDTAQKRVNIRPFLTWLWSNARHLWNGLVDAVRWGWFTFSGYWWNLPGWVRSVAVWFTGGTIWDIYVSLRGYFFGW